MAWYNADGEQNRTGRAHTDFHDEKRNGFCSAARVVYVYDMDGNYYCLGGELRESTGIYFDCLEGFVAS
jgi:hypothetical protein